VRSASGRSASGGSASGRSYTSRPQIDSSGSGSDWVWDESYNRYKRWSRSQNRWVWQ
jgi:hypothetical protein